MKSVQVRSEHAFEEVIWWLRIANGFVPPHDNGENRLWIHYAVLSYLQKKIEDERSTSVVQLSIFQLRVYPIGPWPGMRQSNNGVINFTSSTWNLGKL